MSKVSQADAAAHRNTVVTSASRMLRERGAAGVSVQDAMAAAGLTHGGFYKHFESKDALIGEAAAQSFDQVLDLIDRATTSGDAVAARASIIDDYLTATHRDLPADGCANTALAAESARATPDSPLRAAYLAGVRETIARLEAVEPTAGAHARAVEDLAMMVGALTLARATQGDPISDQVLSIARAALARGID